jgi:hypothetical protein
MRINLKNTPEQVELIKAMGSHDVSVAREANEAFAAFLGPVVRRVLAQASTAGAIYVDAPYDEDDSPSYPLDLYYNDGDNVVTTFMQSIAGGLPSSHVEGMSELKISTYRLDAAVSLLKRYARRGRLDVVSKAVERMAQEILVKQERNAWAVILKALAEASTGGNTHLTTATAASVFQLDDMNKLMTRIRRINESFANGTPDVAYSNGLTDMYMSPEMIEQVRAFAYQPMNTRNPAGTAATATHDGIALPDSIRESVFRAAGMQELYGVNIHEMHELGSSKKYNTLFKSLYSGSFTDATDELIIGLDNSKGAFIRPVAQQHESGGQFVTIPDDQFSARAEKLGFYGFLEEGRVCIDARAVVGIVV